MSNNPPVNEVLEGLRAARRVREAREAKARAATLIAGWITLVAFAAGNYLVTRDVQNAIVWAFWFFPLFHVGVWLFHYAVERHNLKKVGGGAEVLKSLGHDSPQAP